MALTAKQKKLMSTDANNRKYLDQETVVYKIYTPSGSYVGITGNNPLALQIRWSKHLEAFTKKNVVITGMQVIHKFSNRFLALEMEALLRPEAEMGHNKNPGGIRGYHWK